MPAKSASKTRKNSSQKRIAVFASGNGSNFLNIVKEIRSGCLKAELPLLVCDQPTAGVLKHALKYKIPTLVLERSAYDSRDLYENEIIRNLKALKIDYVVLAGFMRILGPVLIKAYRNRVINIHPALLPSFKGSHGIKDALDYGVKLTGVTVHFVDEKMDHGPIILQEAVAILAKDDFASLSKKIHRIEYKIYPQALRLLLSGRLHISARRVHLLPRK